MIRLQNIIETNNLTKVYQDGRTALNKLNISVKEGEIFSLLGQNGAGKSTLIQILTTGLQPTAGKVTVLGRNLVGNVNFIRKNLCCVAQNNSIDDNLTLYENMLFQGRLYHLESKVLTKRITELLVSLNLEKYRNKKVGICSGGVQRLLTVAMSMISIPKILFLDEPTSGMDIEARRLMWRLIQTINEQYNTTIFLTTHYLEEADQLSDRICIIKEGQEQIIGTTAELKHYLAQDLIKLSFANPSAITKNDYSELLKQQSFVKKIGTTKNTLTIEVENAQVDYSKLLKIITAKPVDFYRVEIVQPTLDDVFLAIANKEEMYERDN